MFTTSQILTTQEGEQVQEIVFKSIIKDAQIQDKLEVETTVLPAQITHEPKTMEHNVDQTIVETMKSSTTMELADHAALDKLLTLKTIHVIKSLDH
jgi:hypothetical protein